MILYQNYIIIISVYLYLIIKIICNIVEKYRPSMYNKQPTLTSIPEQIEKDEEIIKWVPKKKHEVLKAKYKCLKKLFQIYDASVIGILPQNYTIQEEERPHRRRSRRTKTDACAGTTEDYNGDVSENEAVTVINELQLNNDSSSQIDKSKTSMSNRDDKSTQDSKEDVSIGDRSDDRQVPYLMMKGKKKPTRFQMFLQRILGIKQEKNYYYDSDNNINRRRRNGLQFRRLRRPKRSHSDVGLRDVKNPVILSYVQSIQRNYLMDTTPRHCPMVGCSMISYGIINYNDHLNLCHFPDRKFVCHYCHEGYTKEIDKIQHENEHIGINKVIPQVATTLSTTRLSTKMASNTQTEPPQVDVPEEKLKKIVSFFDKITNPQNFTSVKKNSSENLQSCCCQSQPENDSDIKRNSSETLRTCQCHAKSENDSNSNRSENSSQKSKTSKRGVSCGHLKDRSGSRISSETDFSCLPVRCQLCGERFQHRRQLSLHVDLEHRVNEKFSKFHSCAGIVNHKQKSQCQIIENNSQSFTLSTDNETTKSENLSYDPSTNIVYYTSTESLDKKPMKDVQKVPTGFCYKWEPCKSVIRV